MLFLCNLLDITVNIFMDIDKELRSNDCNVVQLKVKGDDASDVIITAKAVQSICPSPHSQAIKFYKN